MIQLNNTQFVIIFITAAALVLLAVAVILHRQPTLADPGFRAARDAYKHALEQLRDRPHDPALREHILSAGHAYNFYPLPYGTRAEQLQALDDQLARGEISEAQHAHRRAIVART